VPGGGSGRAWNLDYCVDFTQAWPFGPDELDFTYASHVVEHLFPEMRDRPINRTAESLRSGGDEGVQQSAGKTLVPDFRGDIQGP